MTLFLAAPPPAPVHNTWAAPGLATGFTVVIAAAVFALVRSARGRIRNPTDYLLAGRNVDARQNALALVGSAIMYTTAIIIAGHIALNGFDGVLLLTAFTISTILAVLVYAGPVRNVGGYTLGDLWELRARQRPARIASAVVSLTVYTMFMIFTLATLALVASRMFSTSSTVDKPLVASVVAVVGLLTVLWVYAGGMVGLTRVLVLKVVLVIGMVAVLAVAVLAKYDMNPFHMLDAAEAHAAPNKHGHDLLGPGRLLGKGGTAHSDQDPWVHMSKLISVAMGAMGMPFLFMRHFTAVNGREARRSAGWASMIIVAFYFCMTILGLGAVAILGGKNIGLLPEHRDITLPKLADELGGKWATGMLGAVGLLSVAAIFGVQIISAVTSFTKDINAARGRQPEPADELKQIRRNVLVIGLGYLVVGMAMLTQRTHIMVPTSIDLGAAVVLPAVVYSLFWRRFNTAGLLWTVYGGMAVTFFMVVFSNGVSGDVAALFPDSDFKFIDFEPGMVTGPLGFLLGFVGTLTSSERNDRAFKEIRVRALTGAVPPAQKKDLTVVGPEQRDRDSRTPSEAR
ncbi:cation acetate symporter [Streptomyces sp. NK08204]|uniref:solute symporter family protein n=1 Tax=Streptomyces sp. NK08204 TaxID=2873260 RepID=UPI001CEC21F8|nr:Na+:solute symporter [Streptomyces sp. NK08204]